MKYELVLFDIKVHYKINDYYHCTQKTVKAKDLETQITNILGSIEITAKFTDWAREVFLDMHKNEIYEQKQMSNELEELRKD